jgi:hypothetical protein
MEEEEGDVEEGKRTNDCLFSYQFQFPVPSFYR